MAVKTRDEILSAIRDHFADDTSDETLTFIEDVTDTFSDLENKAKPGGKDWEAEAKRIDEDWRKKYKERFFSGKVEEESDEEEKETKPLRFEDLFKEG